jgi:choline kinase
MRAVILAAGSGTRMNGHTGRAPKALLPVGRESLIQRQLRALRRAGVDEIAVVVGCEAARVRQHCGHGITYVENVRYAETNSLYSLWLARPLLYEGCIVLNCDVLFHPQLLTDLLTSRQECAAVVDYPGPDAPPLGDEEMKVRVRGGRIVEMAKDLPAADADGENVGMVRFGASAAPALVGILDGVVAAGAVREWAPRAFSLFAASHPLWALGTRGFPWIEVDFPDDYQRALDEILPQIEPRASAAARTPIAARPLIAGAAGR